MDDSKRKEYKKRYFEKKIQSAETIECGCGCGEKLLNKDAYGRSKKFISGHNSLRHNDSKTAKQRYYEKNKDTIKAKAAKGKLPRARRLKSEIVIHFGGKCTKCNFEYNGKNACVFQFHHIDPSEKSFEVGVRSFCNLSKKKVWAEAEKCLLLCANCHSMEHSAEY
jgi:hypothetical protein